jgi:hypothetical protein
MAATIFLKNAFCMVGTSPERRTKTVIREKKKAEVRMNMIPLRRLPVGDAATVLELPVVSDVLDVLSADIKTSRIVITQGDVPRLYRRRVVTNFLSGG